MLDIKHEQTHQMADRMIRDAEFHADLVYTQRYSDKPRKIL